MSWKDFSAEHNSTDPVLLRDRKVGNFLLITLNFHNLTLQTDYRAKICLIVGIFPLNMMKTVVTWKISTKPKSLCWNLFDFREVMSFVSVFRLGNILPNTMVPFLSPYEVGKCVKFTFSRSRMGNSTTKTDFVENCFVTARKVFLGNFLELISLKKSPKWLFRPAESASCRKFGSIEFSAEYDCTGPVPEIGKCRTVHFKDL